MYLSSIILKRRAPKEWTDIQRRAALVNNIPPIGHDENEGLFTQLQLNLAGVEPAESTQGLDASIGRAGLIHVDAQDSPLGYTLLFAMGNLDRLNIDPGRFYAVEVGAYSVMRNFRLINLNALHFHGGTPPRAAPGQEIPRNALRAVTVPYNNLDIATNNSASVFGNTGKNSFVDMINRVRYNDEAMDALLKGRLNYLRDGNSIVPDLPFVNFVGCSTAVFLETLFAQTDRVRLNPDFMQHLLIDAKTNQPIDIMKGWDYHPGVLGEKKQEMKETMDILGDMMNDVRMTIPSQLKKMLNNTIVIDKDTGLLKELPAGSAPSKRPPIKKNPKKKQGRRYCSF